MLLETHALESAGSFEKVLDLENESLKHPLQDHIQLSTILVEKDNQLLKAVVNVYFLRCSCYALQGVSLSPLPKYYCIVLNFVLSGEEQEVMKRKLGQMGKHSLWLVISHFR